MTRSEITHAHNAQDRKDSASINFIEADIARDEAQIILLSHDITEHRHSIARDEIRMEKLESDLPWKRGRLERMRKKLGK